MLGLILQNGEIQLIELMLSGLKNFITNDF